MASLHYGLFMTDQTLANPPRSFSTPAPSGSPLSQDDVAAIDQLRQTYKNLRGELARVIIGQDTVIERLLICIWPADTAY